MFQSLTNPMFIFMLISLIVSLVIHEFAHALVADALGDKTARLSGRLTLNPIAHFEPLGLLMILFAPIGWAKPVSVDAGQFKHPRLGLFLTALAGPMSNLLLACLSLLTLRLDPGMNPNSFWYSLVTTAALVNVNLCVFNLIPVPPLDGSRLVSSWLSYRWERAYRKFEMYGPFLLMMVFILPPVRDAMFNTVFRTAQAFVASWFGLYVG